MRKTVTLLAIMVLLFAVARTEASNTVTISFSKLPTDSTYGYDVNKDGIDDLVFKTDNFSGFVPSGPEPSSLGKIEHPGLAGHIHTDNHEVIVKFLGGATGSISFDFAVPSHVDPKRGNKGHPEAWIQIYGNGDSDRVTASNQATGSPAKGFIKIDFPFIANRAVIDFYSGRGDSFIMDNFKVTSGTTQNPIASRQVSSQ